MADLEVDNIRFAVERLTGKFSAGSDLLHSNPGPVSLESSLQNGPFHVAATDWFGEYLLVFRNLIETQTAHSAFRKDCMNTTHVNTDAIPGDRWNATRPTQHHP